jgi:hypothetical protein
VHAELPSSSPSGTINLFIMDAPTATESLSTSAFIITAVPSLPQTAYYVVCPPPSSTDTLARRANRPAITSSAPA